MSPYPTRVFQDRVTLWAKRAPSHPPNKSLSLGNTPISQKIVTKMLNMSPRCKDLLRWLEIPVKFEYNTLTKPGSSLRG